MGFLSIVVEANTSDVVPAARLDRALLAGERAQEQDQADDQGEGDGGGQEVAGVESHQEARFWRMVSRPDRYRWAKSSGRTTRPSRDQMVWREMPVSRARSVCETWAACLRCRRSGPVIGVLVTGDLGHLSTGRGLCQDITRDCVLRRQHMSLHCAISRRTWGETMKTAAQRGPIGAWLLTEREKRGWSVPQMLRFLAAKEVVLNESAYRDYEAGGRTPGKVRLEEMAAALGSQPVPPAPLELMLEAVTGQTAAIAALVDELRAWRTEDRPRLDALERGLVVALGGSRPPEPRGLASAAQPARRR